jgi:ribosomal protein S18 acetylase RimI-like enzyme
MELSMVPWDSHVFGYPVAQVDRVLMLDHCAPVIVPNLHKWFDDHGVRLASCRLSSKRLRETMLLEANGFRFIEMIYSPSLESSGRLPHINCDLCIEPARREDLQEIASIAGQAFTTGRHLMDWRLPARLGNARYREWVLGSFMRGEHQVLKATLGGVLVGFFVIEERSDGVVHWHLTAISPSWQGRGLGKALWCAMARRNFDAGFKRIETTISAHNTNVINIYGRLGFRIEDPQITLHWVPD